MEERFRSGQRTREGAMKCIRLLLPLLLAVRLFVQYQYFLTDRFQWSGTDPNWSVPDPRYTTFNGLRWNPSVSQGLPDAPIIFAGQVPANDRYEIRTFIPYPSTYGGTYSHYAAISTIQGLLSYYDIDFSAIPGTPCSATVYVNRVDVVSDGSGG